MTSTRPFVDKSIETANLHLPIGAGLVRVGPRQNFINQHFALGFDGFSLRLNCFKPRLNDFVGLVTSVVETFPHRVVGRTALVAGFPLIAHCAQRILLFATAHRFDQQCLGFDDQFFTNLIGTPALPTFKLARVGQCGMRGSFQLAVNIADVLFQRLPQVGCDFGGGLAMTFSHFMLQADNRFLHDGSGFFTQIFQNRRIHLWLDSTISAVAPGSGCAFPTQLAQFVSPHRHGWQWRRLVVGGFDSDGNSRLKRVPHGQQLTARSVE